MLMAMRKKLNKHTDKKVFKRTAVRTRKINVSTGVVPRGGIRL